jgi:hypothetical protein
MPVKWRGRNSRRGRVSGSLADWTAAAEGTSAVAGTFLGRISGLVYDFTGALAGTYQASAQRTGVISTTLANWSGSISGNENSLVAWTDGLGDNFTIQAGVPFSYTFIATDPDEGDLIDILINSATPGLVVTENAQVGTSRSVTISTAGYPGGSGLTASTYTAQLDVAESTTAEADWLTRSAASGVVWAHDFREAGELTAFLADPTGSGNVSLQSAGFGSGGYLRYTIPKGIPDGKYFVPADASSGAGWLVVDGATLSQPADGQSNAEWTWAAAGTLSVGKGTWQRPFTALVAGISGGNGKTTPDPAAAGTLTRRTLTSTSASNYSTLRAGYYGHSSYQSTTWNLLGGYTANSASWDGTDFWIQYRVRISASRFGSLTNPDRTYNQYRYPNGKLAAVMTNYITPAQAIVVQSLTHDPRVNHSTAEFGMYMHSAESSFVALTYPPNMPNLSAFQPGGEYDPPSTGQCRWDNSGYYVRNCWEWPADEWVTVLMHIIPGRDNTGLATENTLSTAPYRDTGIQVWVARENASSYTSLWNVVDDGSGTGFPFFFLDGSGQVHPPAWNMFIPWAYMNNAPALQQWTQDFTQIIFKKGNGGLNPNTDGIACPQA